MIPGEEIRIASKNDLPAIDRIYNQAVDIGFRTAHTTALTPEQRTAWFRGHDPQTFPVFVFTRDEKILGWISFSPYRAGRAALDETAELSFYVDFQHHGEGIGSKMMAHCLERSAILNKRVLFSVVIEGNQGSIRLLQKYGFQQWGYLPEVIRYNNQRCGHIYMGRIISV